MKKSNELIRKVKLTSNLSTIAFIAYMTYTISAWQKVSGFDSFINVIVTGLIMAVNIRFYNIYSNLAAVNETSKTSTNIQTAKRYQKEYFQLIRICLWMSIALIVLKLMSS